ncbi:ATP-dependent DNA helicase [Caerostris darwini]|uniref:ATP-dependent DNA helicase n=1 Tax=Caerostris darwini TaxID=1538125 RepID=A0AAV4T4J7_9ARAC|nr:ATP-dependent DNA helicase [Caerostris darwini]
MFTSTLLQKSGIQVHEDDQMQSGSLGKRKKSRVCSNPIICLKLVPPKNALQRERRALKRQQAVNPHDDNIKHTKCVQTPSLYSPSCSCPLKDTFNSSSSITPSCSHCFMNNTHSDLNDYSHEKQWLKVEERFFKSIADGPTHRCYCCDRLYMKKNLVSYSKADLRARGFTEEQIAIIFSVDLDEADFCKTCSDHIRKRNVPNLAANYGFRYPEQLSCLSELNDLEERLVALRIPFMQIRKLGRDRQYGIKGSVTNVPNDLHKSVDCLPRNVNDSTTI